jgi:hypothetical protein
LQLMLEGRFRQIWVPSWENRDLRQLLWHRHRMVQARTRLRPRDVSLIHLAPCAMSFILTRMHSGFTVYGSEEFIRPSCSQVGYGPSQQAGCVPGLRSGSRSVFCGVLHRAERPHVSMY